MPSPSVLTRHGRARLIGANLSAPAHAPSSWPGLTRPSTSCLPTEQPMAGHRAGHQ
jgi:hypothetical protein